MTEVVVEKYKYQAQKDYYDKKKDDPFTQEMNRNKNYHYYNSQSKSEDPIVRETYRLKRQEYAKRAYLKIKAAKQQST
jgi:hypothetical protein